MNEDALISCPVPLCTDADTHKTNQLDDYDIGRPNDRNNTTKEPHFSTSWYDFLHFVQSEKQIFRLAFISSLNQQNSLSDRKHQILIVQRHKLFQRKPHLIEGNISQYISMMAVFHRHKVERTHRPTMLKCQISNPGHFSINHDFM
jgi:hypothetical protein